MRWLIRLFVLCAVISTLAFGQSITVDWTSPTDSSVLSFDSGQWWFHPSLGGPADSLFHVNFYGYSGFDTASLWIKISRNGEPFEEITGYHTEFAYDNANAEGSFRLLGLEGGGSYELCAHIANMYGDTTDCVQFFTESIMDTCPPEVVGWNPNPDTTCYDGYVSVVICDNSLDCSQVTDVDPSSIQLMLNIPGIPEPIDVTSHTYTYSTGGPHCVEVDFNPNYPCDSLNYLIQPGTDIQFCVSAADYAGNAIPEPDCITYTVCPDTCSPEVYNPSLSDTMLEFDGTWHLPSGDTVWTFGFDDHYSECVPTPFDTATIGILIRDCGDTTWRFVQAPHIAINLDPGYCRLGGSASGLFDDLGLECGHCYEIKAQAGDVEGNIGEAYGVVRIHTQECLPDSCDPFVSVWHPSSYDTSCFPYDGNIWFVVEDPSTEYCSCTGVYYIEAELNNGDSTFFLTVPDGLNRIDLSDCSAKFVLDPAFYQLIPGGTATLVVHGYDGASRTFWDTLEFSVCDTATPPPSDTCSPYISRWMPGDTGCIPVDASIGAEICDNNPDCDNSGLVPDSITVWVRIDDDTLQTDITDQCFFDPSGDYCIIVNWNHTGSALPNDVDIQLCILAIDNAGNEYYECHYWHTCAAEDTCPPTVNWTTPADGETLTFDGGYWSSGSGAHPDTAFYVYFEEFGCPGTGLVDSSLFIRIRDCDDTVWTYIDGYGTLFGWDYGDASGSFDLLGLEPGHCYTLCAGIMDGAGNWGDDCITFYTESVVEDTCPPVVVAWHPADGDTYCFDGDIHLYIQDPVDTIDCPVCSGIDMGSFEAFMDVVHSDSTVDTFTFEDGMGIWHHYEGDCGVVVHLDDAYYMLNHGDYVHLCVGVNDGAGNHLSDCIEFAVCDTTPAPEDTCPPVVVNWHPADGDTYCFDGGIWFDIVDPVDTLGCPLCSGIDSIVVGMGVQHSGSDTSYYVLTDGSGLWLDYGDSCEVVVVLDDSFYTLQYGDEVSLCVDVYDGAGNYGWDCVYFTVCDTTTEPVDTCPPFVFDWHPADGDTFCFGGPIDFMIRDPVGLGTGCPICSGIDMESIEAVMVATSSSGVVDTFIFEYGSGLIVDPAGSCNVYVALDTSYYSLGPGDVVRLCVGASDGVGNYGHDCIEFTVCDTTMPTDTCPPVFLGWLPDGCLPIYGAFEVHITDPLDSLDCPYASGMDRTDFSVIVYFDSETLDVSDDCTVGGMGYYGISISWGPAAFAYPPDEDVTVCVTVQDHAGNEASECHTYHTCAAGDTCPPTIEWTVPTVEPVETLYYDSGKWQTALGDTAFNLNIIEYGCPQTGISDYNIYFGPCDATPVLITDYDSYEGPSYIYAWGSFNSLGLEPGQCYRLCADATDSAGNSSESCVTFYTAETESVDLCPPIVTSWFPGGDSCLPVDAGLGLMLTDPVGDGCPIATGVNSSSVVVTITMDDDTTFDITSYCDIYSYGMYVGVEWAHPSFAFPEGTDITLCVSAEDYYGNSMDSCYTWTTCGEPETLDVCPPIAELYYPDTSGCLPVDDIVEMFVYDNNDTGCYFSGIDSSTIVVTFSLGDDTSEVITDECTIYGSPYYGYALNWDYSGLTPGDNVRLCVSAADFAGNYIDPPQCYNWTVCGEETTDVCPPYVSWTSIYDGDSLVPVDAFIGFDLDDPEDTCSCTGIDTSSIVVTLTSETDTLEFTVGDGLIFEPYECGGYGYIDTSVIELEPGTEYTLCIDASDNAGNEMETYCITFFTVPETTVDIWPPCFDDWTPSMGDTNVPVDAIIGVGICDVCPDAETYTGVDSVYAEIWAFSPEIGTLSVDFDMELDPIFCAGYYVTLDPLEDLPECSYIYVEIYAWDSAGNMSSDYLAFHTYCEPETTDIWPPCVNAIWPEPGDTIGAHTDVGITFCDMCEGALYFSGVDSSSIVLSVDGEDVTDELVFYEVDCYGWAVNWVSGPLPIGEHTVCAEAYDFAGNFVDTCWSFYVYYDTTYEFDMLEPLDETWVNNPEKKIIGYFADGPIPPDFSFDVNGITYDFSSPEVVLSGDTLYFTPSMPWEDGDTVCYHIADESGCFYVDLTSPEIEFVEPPCGDTLDDSPSMIEIGFSDALSGVDETTIGVQISTSVGSWNFHTGMTGVNWDGSILTIDLSALDIDLVGNVSVYAWAGDSPDYTFDLSDTIMPNYNFETCTFRVTPVIMSTIAGHVISIADSMPVPGAHVIILPYIHGWPIWLYPGSFGPISIVTTDADGFFAVDVGPGRWMVAMKPPVGPMIFWDGHRWPLAADPVRVGPSSPDTIYCDFVAGILAPDVMEHHQVSGMVSADGEPVIQSFVVVISTDDDDEELSISADMTDSAGLFSCPVRNGSYWVTAFKPGYFPTYLGNKWNWQDADTIYVSGTDVSDVDITLNTLSEGVGPNTVYGTVYDVSDSTTTPPMRGVIVYLNDPTSGDCKFAGVSDYDGNYEIDNVPDGVYQLAADRSYYLPQGEWETVNSSDGIEHDIYIYRRASGIDENVKLPESVRIMSVRPNPFNTSAEIEFFIPQSGEVSLEIVDVMGHTVAKLFDGNVSQGHYIAIWNGEGQSSGIYFAKLHFGDRTVSTKLLLTK